MNERTYCDGAVIQISARNFDDERGRLCPIEFPIMGFSPMLAFVINGVPGSVRGGHGHKIAQQLLMLVSGKIEVELRYGNSAETVLLDQDNRIILIKPMVWSRQKYLTENASLMVFSDIHYDPDEYFQGEYAPAGDG